MNKKQIKIIKKKDLAAVKMKGSAKEKQVSENPKKMVSNVSSWVNEFQKRKRQETQRAIETIFANRVQNVES